MIRALALFLVVALAPAMAPAAAAAWPQQQPDPGKPEKGKQGPALVVLRGTVFTEQGFALPGAQIRVRRAEEKKVRGKATADRRGEFGVRLRDGCEYEVTVEAKGYQTQARKFSAQPGATLNLVFRMQPASGGTP